MHDKDLTSAQKLVAAEILDCYNDDLGYSFAGLDYMARNLKLARSTVAEAVSELTATGYIETVGIGGGRGRSTRRRPVWDRGIDRPPSSGETVRPAGQKAGSRKTVRATGQKEGVNCPIDDVNCPASQTQTVRPAGPDSSYRLYLQDCSADSAPREDSGAGADVDARQGEEGGTRRSKHGNVVSIGNASSHRRRRKARCG